MPLFFRFPIPILEPLFVRPSPCIDPFPLFVAFTPPLAEDLPPLGFGAFRFIHRGGIKHNGPKPIKSLRFALIKASFTNS